MIGHVEALRTRIAQEHLSSLTLKIIITLWALGVIALVWFVVDNPWLLAGILAYEVLP